jgi:glycosyltransferase involved in cell wall biosynthesis
MAQVPGTAPPKRKAMTILHVSSAKSWRGGEQQIAYLLEELAKRGISQEVFCPANTPLADFCKKHNIMHTTYRKRFSVNPLVARQLAKLSSQQNCDLVHLHDSHAHTFGCMAAALFGMKTPLVLHRRVDYPAGNNVFSRWKYNHPQIKAIICVSAFVKAVLENTVREVSKMQVVYSGVDLNRFTQKKGDILRREFQVPKGHYIVANVAAITEQKDYHTFVRTAAHLVRYGLPIRFFIIGEGKQRADIERYVAEQGLSKHIVFTGFRKDIAAIFPEIDLLLFTSRKEGLGTTLLDAQGYGVPIVATNVGGIPEIVEAGKTALLAESGDDTSLAEQVRFLLENKDFREGMVEQARQSAVRFSKEHMAAGVTNIYKLSTVNSYS